MAGGLIVIGRLNPYEHEDAGSLTASVRGMLGDLCALIAAAGEEGLRIVYVTTTTAIGPPRPKEIRPQRARGRTRVASLTHAGHRLR